jgi:hypothetical protein
MFVESFLRIMITARGLFFDVARRRLTVLLLLVVPAAFNAVVLLTTAKREVEVTVATLVEDGADIHVPGTVDMSDFSILDNGSRRLAQRPLSLVFLGTAAVSFLACFLAFNLVHKRRDVDLRLVRAGLRVHELLLAKLLVLVTIVAVLAVYETAMVAPWVSPRHPFRMGSGFLLGSTVYGCLGVLIGAIVNNELEGVFMILLLTNIDAGWLQNPIYYAMSERRSIIEWLPAHYPTQIAITSAFSDEVPKGLSMRALGHAAWAAVGSLLVLLFRARRNHT